MTSTQLAPLPVRLNPDYKEGPRHYLMRLAEANGYSAKDLIALGYDYGRQFLPWFDAVSNELNHASTKAIQSHWELSRGSWLIWTGRVCPRCMAEIPCTVGTVGWELKFADACIKHECWLIDTCTCGNVLKPFRPNVHLCDCGRKLASIPTQTAPRPIVELSHYLVRAVSTPFQQTTLATSTREHTFGQQNSPTNISQLNLFDLQKLIGIVGQYAIPNAKKRTPHYMSVDHLSRSWHVSSIAAEALCNWPVGFRRVLDWLRTTHDDGTTHRLSQRFGPLYARLYSTLGEPQFDFIRIAFEDHLAAHWPAVLKRPNSRLLRQTQRHVAWISCAQACRRASVTTKTLREWVVSGIVEGDARITPKGHTRLVVNEASLTSLINNRKEYLDYDLLEVGRHLGLCKRRLRRIIQRLFTTAKKGPDLVWRVAKTEVNALLACSTNSKAIEQILEHEPLVTLNGALRYHRLTDAGLLWLIKGVLTKKISPPKVIMTSGTGVGAWVFELQQIQDAMRASQSAVDDTIKNSVTLPDLATRWNLKQEVIYRLANDGAFAVYRVTGLGQRGRLVSQQEVERFENEYVAARELAPKLRTTPRWLAGQLKEQGIEPAFGPKATGCRQLFYRRTPEMITALTTLSSRISHHVDPLKARTRPKVVLETPSRSHCGS